MSDVIIFSNSNGSVSVCVPTGELLVEEVQAKDIPVGIESFIIDSDTLPNDDDDFFDAWEQTNGVVTVNINKAKQVTKDRLRFERGPLLAAQDVLFMRALETGQDTSAILAEKQRLRDITILTDTCTTTTELRALKANQ